MACLGWLGTGLGGCAQPWKFSHGASLSATSSGPGGVAAAAGPGPATNAGSAPQPVLPQATPAAPGPQQAQPGSGQPVNYLGPSDPMLGPTPLAGNVGPGPALADEHWPAPNLYPSPAPPGVLGPPLPPGGNPPASQPPAGEPLLAAMWDRTFPNVCSDYTNYYSWPTAINLAAGLGIAAGVANTDLDGKIQTWYQTHIHSEESYRIAKFIRPFGEGQNTIPVAAGLALLDDTGWLDDRPVLSEIGQWGDRVARAYLVGAAPTLFMEYATGGSRPRYTDGHSWWRPFSASNGVSGDAFMSSCMWISAADMTEQPLGKGFFYACSFVVPWERIDLNGHFLSQAALGWWMGYLACDAVNHTQLAKGHVTLVPLASPEMTGVGVMYQH